jgi:FeS assembly SUF system protein
MTMKTDTEEPMAGEAAPTNPPSAAALQKRAIEALRTVYDPEMPVNIFDLGLVYSVDVTPPDTVRIRMSLTNAFCPVADAMTDEARTAVKEQTGMRDVTVELVWDPPWNREMMTDAAKLELGML